MNLKQPPMTRRRSLIPWSLLILAGCAGIPPPSQIGQTAGSIAGAAIAPGVGMPIGALIGTLAGMLIEHQVDQSTQRKERVDLGRQLATGPSRSGQGPPGPIAGTPTRVWVDEHVEQGRLMAGHFELRNVP